MSGATRGSDRALTMVPILKETDATAWCFSPARLYLVSTEHAICLTTHPDKKP